MNIIQYLGRGIFHEEAGEGCQDYCDFYVPREDNKVQNTVLALSDGCSSSLYALEAAKANVEAVLEIFKKVSLKTFLKQSRQNQKIIIHKACLDHINEIEQATDYSQCCATLVFVVMDEECILLGHIGDGAIFCMDAQDDFFFTSDPENGETLSHTHFTVEDDLTHTHLTILEKQDVKNILLCSDGPYKMFMKYGTPRRSNAVKQISSWLSQEKIKNCTTLRESINALTTDLPEHGDDWSLLVAVPGGEQCDDFYEEPLSMQMDALQKLAPEQYEAMLAQAEATASSSDEEAAQEANELEAIPSASSEDASSEDADESASETENPKKEPQKSADPAEPPLTAVPEDKTPGTGTETDSADTTPKAEKKPSFLSAISKKIGNHLSVWEDE